MNKIYKRSLTTRILAIIFAFVCTFGVSACKTRTDKNYNENNDNVHEHVFGEWETVNEATCEHEGLRVRTCEVCDETEEEVIPITAHDYVVDKGYPPSFTTTGLTDGAHCAVCGDVLVEQTEIPKLKEEDYGYRVAIGSDEHVSVYVYSTQDYDDEPILADMAYARDSSSGELLKNGSGQVNFELRFDEGYYLKEILISPSTKYNALKDEKDTGKENTYRITKITDNLVMFVTSQKQIELADFASITDDDGNVTFSWARDDRIEYVSVNVTSNGDNAEYKAEGRTWTFEEMESNVQYTFEFTPYSADGTAGDSTTCTRFYNSEVKDVAFPRVEITTQNYVFPSCDYVSPPEDCIGADIINNEYVQCVVNIFDANKNAVYSSSETSDFAKAKIKVRGNSSAYSEKKPYKIKLSSKADLLSSFIDDRTDKNYTHKEWVLLNAGYYARQIVGTSIAESVGMDYIPSYTYCELYLNGDYRGLYILSDAVTQGNGTGNEQSRCAVDDDGFIVELDAYWWNEDISFTTLLTAYHMRYTFEYPDSDDITADSEVVSYIRDYIIKAETALKNGDEDYINYMDIESFAKWLLGHDILASYDAGGTNMYVCKKDSTEDTKLFMPVLWDFDSICSNDYINNLAEIRTKPYFFASTLQSDEKFIEVYYELFNSVKDSVISNLLQKTSDFDKDNYNALMEIERVRWQNTGIGFNDFDTQINGYVSWFTEHLAWMEEYFSVYN